MKLRWILATVLVAGATYFALFGGDYGFFDVRRLEKEKAVEEQKLRDLQAELARLRTHADSLENDSATLERIAREKYGLIRDGEKLYRFVDSSKTATDSAKRDSASVDRKRKNR